MLFIIFLYVLLAIGAVILDYMLARMFQRAAEAKGHDSNKYFWLCFLLGIVGYCLVASLPDLVLRDRIDRLENNQKASQTQPVQQSEAPQQKPVTQAAGESDKNSVSTQKRVQGPVDYTTWTCECGRVNKNHVFTCACGKSVWDLRRG